MGVIGIRFNYRQILTAACTLIAVLAIAAPASAAKCVGSSVTQDQYAENVDQVKVCDEGGTGDPGDPPATGSLPFTGLDLGLMGGAAVALLAGGFLISRRARAEEEA
jgi:hypothetical protein